MMNRRAFLQQVVLGSAGLALSVNQGWAFEGSGQASQRLIVIFLRGGLDGLYAFAPVDDPRLASLRPTLSKTILSQGLRLGQTGFAAHPACSKLVDLFNSKELSFAPCAGTVDKSRSHFQAQDLFELGTGQFHGNSGFMARTAQILGGSGQAISFTQEIPLSFQGGANLPQVAPLTGSGLKIPGGPLRNAILAAYQQQKAGVDIQQAIQTESELEKTQQSGEFTAAKQAAAVNGFPKVAQHMSEFLKANPALSLAFLDLGGFDTHYNEDGILSKSLQNFAEGISTIKDSLGEAEWQRTRVVVMSEFGRTVHENGTLGTDHGHGGLALLTGGAIAGGQLLGGFHGLADDALNENRDLPVLLDWRQLIGANMSAAFGFKQADLNKVFPGFKVMV